MAVNVGSDRFSEMLLYSAYICDGLDKKSLRGLCSAMRLKRLVFYWFIAFGRRSAFMRLGAASS